MENQEFAQMLMSFFEQQVTAYQTQIDLLKKLTHSTDSNSSGPKKGKANVKDSAKGGKPNEGDGQQEGKRNKKNKNSKPRALTAYQIYMKEQFPNFKGLNPQMPPIEIMSLMSKQWKELDPSIKKEYTDRSEEIKTAAAAELSSAETSSSTIPKAIPQASPNKVVPPKPAAVTASTSTPVKVAATTTKLAVVEKKVTQDDDFENDEGDDADKKKRKKKKHHHDSDEGQEDRKKHKKSHKKEE